MMLIRCYQGQEEQSMEASYVNAAGLVIDQTLTNKVSRQLLHIIVLEPDLFFQHLSRSTKLLLQSFLSTSSLSSSDERLSRACDMLEAYVPRLIELEAGLDLLHTPASSGTSELTRTSLFGNSPGSTQEKTQTLQHLLLATVKFHKEALNILLDQQNTRHSV